MASKNFKYYALADTLEGLMRSDLRSFCVKLVHREDVRVDALDLMDPDPADITHLLVSTYTEDGALSAAVDTLKEIGCYREAERLSDVVQQAAEVKTSQVQLSQPVFPLKGLLMRAGFPVKINCKVFIYKTNKSFLTLHVYLIPPDPALQQTIDKNELSSGHKVIQKPYPERSLKMGDRFVLTADKDGARIYPQTLKLIYESSDPNFFEVFIKNPDSDIQLTLSNESGPVWTCVIRKDDYESTGDIPVTYELARVRAKFVDIVSREVITQLLDDLLVDGVLNDWEKDSILEETSRADMARCLIDTVRKKGHKASSRIFAHLRTRDPPLCAYLGLPLLPTQGSDVRGSSLKYLDSVTRKMTTKMIMRSEMSPEVDWIKLDPEVNSVDTPTYSLQSGAGNFECSVSGLRWVCKENVSFKYQFGSWEEHMERLETMQYIPGGPLQDINVLAGKLDEVYLPHWICTKDNPAIFSQFAVLHIDNCGYVVEQAAEVTPSHVKLSQPVFSKKGPLMRAGFPVKINCKVLIYKTNKSFLTLHVYLIPPDPALQQTIKNDESSSGHKVIQKPYPERSLKMGNRFVLTADKDDARIYPPNLKLVYEKRNPNFFEVFIKNPDSDIQLTLSHESGPVWTCEIRADDYQTPGDNRVQYDEELDRVRAELVARLSTEVINQLLDDLLGDGVLNDGEKDLILRDSTRSDRTRCLIDTVKLKGREPSRKLFTHLHSRDPTLSAELQLPSGRLV